MNAATKTGTTQRVAWKVRPLLVSVHRWAGLALALVLFVAGITGAVIAWEEEIDSWLNPGFFLSSTPGTPLPAPELIRRIEAADPRVEVAYMVFNVKPGRAIQAEVAPRLDPVTGQPAEIGFNQIAVDPVNGTILDRRDTGATSLAPKTLIPFLNRLHYTMLIPSEGGIAWGIWLVGFLSLVWMVDCLIALYLAFPDRRSWRKSLAFRFKRGGYQLNFDLHRSGGVWLWALLLMLAITSVYMNLTTEVVRPVVSVFSKLSPLPADPHMAHQPATTPSRQLDPSQIFERAQREAAERHIDLPPGSYYRLSDIGVYGVGFFEAGNHYGVGLGNPSLFLDARTGAVITDTLPGRGSAGDTFIQAQYPLHSGRIIGTAGRVLVSLLGIFVAALSVTGVYIWLKKRRARHSRRKRAAPSSSSAAGMVAPGVFPL